MESAGAAVGMTGPGALRFVRRLNELLPGEPLWRLPQLSEARDPGFRFTGAEVRDTRPPEGTRGCRVGGAIALHPDQRLTS